jgi:single-strand DNA-binding protein
MNQATLVGTVIKSELQPTENSQVLKVRLRTATVVMREEGPKTFADYHNVVFWGKAASAAHGQIAKGDVVSVLGRITTRSYQPKEGGKRYVTEINASSIAPLVVDEASDAHGDGEAA